MSLILALTLGVVGDTAQWRNIAGVGGFPNWRGFLTEHVRRHAARRVNHLCVVVRADGDERHPDAATAYVYWPEGRRIEILGQTTEPALSPMMLMQGPIRLDRDVSPDDRQPDLNPRGVTRGWVRELVSRCKSVGTRLTVVKG